MANKAKISVERIKEVLDYNPETGSLTWKQNTAKWDAIGKEAGEKPNYNGYRTVSLDKRDFLAQRLAWVIKTGNFPSGRISFKDGNRLNLKWENLTLQKGLEEKFDCKTREGRILYSKSYNAKNKDKVRENALQKKFGIDLPEYRRMFAAQGGVCAICKCEETTTRNGKLLWLSVDHCHETNEIRSLLCKKCNIGLGSFLDKPSVLEKAAEYLRFHKSKPKEKTNVIKLKKGN